MRRRFFSLVLMVAVVLLGGCRVDSTVELNVETNGGGSIVAEVRLDEEAVAVIGDVDSELRVDDLKEAGWSVTGPRKDGDETVISARHGFANSAEANALVGQLGTNAGPFRDFEIRQQRSLTNVDSEFAGTVDLSQGLQSWGSPELEQRTGQSLGLDPEEIKRNLGVNLEEVFGLSVIVNMPGQTGEVVPEPNDEGVWQIPYGQSVELSAESSGTNWESVGLLGLAVLLIVAAVAVGIFWQTYKPKHKLNQ